MGMKSRELVKIDDWIKELNSGSLNEKEKSKLLLELKSELQTESEVLDRLSSRINILEEELLKRLLFQLVSL